MSISQKQIDANLREKYVEIVSQLLEREGEEVLVIKSNEIALPVIDEQGNDSFVTLTIKVPTGSREGDAFDGYELAQDYKQKLEQKAIKAEKRAKEKAKKIERDKKLRAQKAEMKKSAE
jgi:CheY-like chemotaxis protein